MTHFLPTRQIIRVARETIDYEKLAIILSISFVDGCQEKLDGYLNWYDLSKHDGRGSEQ